MSHVVQEDLPTAPTVSQQPLERSNVADERRMTDMGKNTSNVVIEPTGSGPRSLCMEANAQTSLPIVDALLHSSLGDHVAIPHVNLSILGYEPESLRTSGKRSPPVRAQEVSIIPQLDGPGSLPIRDHTRGTVRRFLDQVELTLPSSRLLYECYIKAGSMYLEICYCNRYLMWLVLLLLCGHK